jgi:hypothetical protein
MVALGVMLTVIAFANPLKTGAVPVTLATSVALRSCPPNVTNALVVRCVGTVAVHARVMACTIAGATAVPHETAVALAIERGEGVDASGILMAVVQPQATFFDIRADAIRPCSRRNCIR